MTSPILELWQVQKSYPKQDGRGQVTIVQDFCLNIEQGEFVSLLGHSGCGKSTVLSMVAGLTPLTSGSMILAGKELDGPGPDRGVVFQSHCLLPWFTSRENVLLGIDQVQPTKTPTERAAIADYYLELVGLEESIHKRPAELSLGMRQRVGLARAFALDPKMLLLDEPFGMLDMLTRIELQDALLELWSRDKKTALMVTHDVDESIFLSDRVVVMTNGPEAKVGRIFTVPFARPRDRTSMMELPEYYDLREEILDYLEELGHPGSHADSSEEESPTADDILPLPVPKAEYGSSIKGKDNTVVTA